MVYGYIRVSTREQNEDRQFIALREMAVPEENLITDKQSGKDFQRPQYKKLVRKLKKDDLLYIKSIDIVALDMSLLDTRRGKDLMGAFLSDIVLQVLSFVAENERKNIRERQKEGIHAAKLRGVQFGRPENPLPDSFEQAYEGWCSGTMSVREAADRCGMCFSTFYRRGMKRRKEEAGT